MGGDQAGRKRDERHKHQERDVDQEEEAIHRFDLSEDGVVVDPDDADREEADGVSDVTGPVLKQPGSKFAWSYPNVQDEQGCRNSEDAIAEGLEPRGGDRRRRGGTIGHGHLNQTIRGHLDQCVRPSGSAPCHHAVVPARRDTSHSEELAFLLVKDANAVVTA